MIEKPKGKRQTRYKNSEGEAATKLVNLDPLNEMQAM